MPEYGSEAIPVGAACPSRSAAGEDCALPAGHRRLHVNAERTLEWVDPTFDPFPNGLYVDGVLVATPEKAP